LWAVSRSGGGETGDARRATTEVIDARAVGAGRVDGRDPRVLSHTHAPAWRSLEQVAAPSPAPLASARRPNIVFILTDDLAMNLVQYMPRVLRMQKEGVSFANYFVSDSLCCPSRSSIFTGRYPHDTGIFRNVGPDGGFLSFRHRGHEQVTFATALSAAGYRTAMLSKYLNGYLPARHSAAPGWTTWAVAGNGYPGFNYNLNQDGAIVHYGGTATDYLTDVLSGLAVRFIKQAPGAPFWIEIATFAPHAPYTPAPRDAEALPGVRAPRSPAFNAAPDASAPQWLLRGHPALSDADVVRVAAQRGDEARSAAPCRCSGGGGRPPTAGSGSAGSALRAGFDHPSSNNSSAMRTRSGTKRD
jgi:hypothetical protein